MLLRFRTACFLLVLLHGPVLSSAYGNSIADKGRDIIEKNERAVIKVKLVIRFKLLMNGSEIRNNETKIEATGTVLDPSGLTIISLSMTDPSKFAQINRQPQTVNGKWEVESELNEVTMVLANKTELPAKVVLRDKDLDLAFIKPSGKPAPPFSAIDTKQIDRLQILDPIFVLGRLGKVAGSVPAIITDRIQAVMQKPRLFYVPQKSADLGAPVFSHAGKWIGIILVRSIKTEDTSPGNMVVILPAADILDVAGQISFHNEN